MGRQVAEALRARVGGLARRVRCLVKGAVGVREYAAQERVTGQGAGKAGSGRCSAGRTLASWVMLAVLVAAAGWGLGPGGTATAAAQERREARPALIPELPTVTLLSPDPAGAVPAGRLWLAVRIEAPAGIRGVTFWWDEPGGERRTLLPEVGGPSDEVATAWYEIFDVTQGLYRLTVQVEDGARQIMGQSWTIQVVGDLALEEELASLEEGLRVRRPSAQQAVDQMAQDGRLWALLEGRYGWRSGTDPIRFHAVWESALGRLTQPLLMRALVEDQPTGFLARGVRAYEQVRGAAYWWDARFPRDPAGGESASAEAAADGWPLGPQYGSQDYDAEREAAGWPAFLAAYRRHPAADDAAYRLGRSHEVLAARFAEGSPERLGHLLAAAWAYLAALELPDGDMAWDARNRLLYLLDAVAAGADLEALASSLAQEARAQAGFVGALIRPGLEEDLRLAVAYALALRHLRAGRYEEAAASLAAVLSALPEAGSWDPLALRTAQTRARVERQAATARDLARLQRQAAGDGLEAVEAAYREAALIYRDPLLFHLALWHGERARYLAFGHVFSAAASEPDRSILAADAARQITYVRALALFDQLLATDPPEPWRERALFSKGMSLYHLLHYGTEVHAWRSPEDLTAELVATFQEFAAQYPASSMADDALLMVGVYGRRPEVLRELIERYPDGDKRPVAEALLEEKPAGRSHGLSEAIAQGEPVASREEPGLQVPVVDP